MERCPFDYKPPGPRGKAASYGRETINRYQYFTSAVLCVKVWRRMVDGIHTSLLQNSSFSSGDVVELLE